MNSTAALQTLLNAAAGEHLEIDGVFGPLTRAAVCRYQATHGLMVDGIAGPVTLSALQGVARAGSSQTLSAAGRDFLYAHESQRGVSDRLYWPGGASGVTLGAGFDMKARDSASIAAQLASLGFPDMVCATAARAAGLSGDEASGFCAANAGLLTLTQAQETLLLRLTVPPYEAIVCAHVVVPLAQHEFDALVSFVYNPGGSFLPVAASINAGNVEAAMTEIRRRVTSGGTQLAGLVRRRADETRLFLTGQYS